MKKILCHTIAALLGVSMAGTSFDVARAKQRLALLVGVTEYPALKREHGDKYEKSIRLYGPANDVVLMRRLLVGQFDFASDAITTLVGWGEPSTRPTRKNIAEAVASLAERAQPGDQVVIFLSGHGTQQPAPTSSEHESDGLDELFLPADTRGWHSGNGRIENAIVDDELSAWLAPIHQKGAALWVMIDSCHAGTATRSLKSEGRKRWLSPGLLGVPSKPSLGHGGLGEKQLVYDADPNMDGASFVRLYATQPDEIARELPFPVDAPDEPASYYGLLTYTVAEVLSQSDSSLTYRELVQQIALRYRRLGRDDPTPYAAGDVDLEVLGTDRNPGRSRMHLTKSSDGWSVSAGAIDGLSVGSILSVHPPAGDASPKRRLGYVEIDNLGVVTASVAPVGYRELPPVDPATIPELARCEVAHYDYSDRKLRVSLDPNGPPRAVSRLREAFETDSRHAQILDWNAPIQLGVREGGTRVVLYELDTNGNENALSAADIDDPNLSSVVAGWLARIYRWQNLKHLAIVANNDATQMGVRTVLYRCGGEAANKCSASCRPEDSQKLPPGGNLPAGSTAAVYVVNSGERELDISLLGLSSDYSITAVFPTEPDHYPRLGPGDRPLWIPFCVDATTTGTEHILAIAVPAKNQPRDFAWLAGSGPTTKSLRDGFEDFLGNAAGKQKTRDLRAAKPILRLLSWETVAKGEPQR